MGAFINMHGNIPASVQDASNAADNYVGKSVSEARKSVSDEDWFAEAAKNLHSKPGLELHLLTDVDERSCHRYAAGAVKPSAYLLRALLRSPQGERWLNALMDGCEAPWWTARRNRRERRRALLAQLDALD